MSAHRWKTRNRGAFFGCSILIPFFSRRNIISLPSVSSLDNKNTLAPRLPTVSIKQTPCAVHNVLATSSVDTYGSIVSFDTVVLSAYASSRPLHFTYFICRLSLLLCFTVPDKIGFACLLVVPLRYQGSCDSCREYQCVKAVRKLFGRRSVYPLSSQMLGMKQTFELIN